MHRVRLSDEAAGRAMINALRELRGQEPLYASERDTARAARAGAFESMPPSMGLIEPDLPHKGREQSHA